MTARLQVVAWQVVVLAALLIAWECAGRASNKFAFLAGSPSAIWSEMKGLVISGELFRHFVVTGTEAGSGFLLGTAIGSLTGLALWYSEIVARITRPFFLALGALPVFAFAPLMIVWFGVGIEMKIAMATFSTVFVALAQAHRGARAVSVGHLELLRGLRASRHQIFRKAIIPGSMDWVLGSLRLNAGFSLLGAFIGEFITSDVGLGYLTLRAGGLYNTPRVFAAAIAIIALALALDGLAALTERYRHVIVQAISVPRPLWQ